MNIYPNKNDVDPLSLSSVRLECFVKGHALGLATGFVIQFQDLYYVITNWHVVLGRDPDTNELMDKKTAAIPDSIKIRDHSKSQFGEWIETSESLYNIEGRQKWLEHPSGREIDVVAIPITENEEIKLFPIDFNLINTDVVLRPAMLVSIIGFPFGLSSTGWPIWKTGHIASDPLVDFDKRRMFLIDATTRVGMSGSPVILRISSGYTLANGIQLSGGRMVTKFLGVYSGRLRDDVDIGRVWRPEVITEIFIPY